MREPLPTFSRRYWPTLYVWKGGQVRNFSYKSVDAWRVLLFADSLWQAPL